MRHLMPRGSRDGARINNQPQVARRGREEGAAAALVDGGAAAATGTGLVGCLSLSLSGRGLRVGPLSPVAALLLRAAPGAGLGLVAETEGVPPPPPAAWWVGFGERGERRGSVKQRQMGQAQSA